MPKQNQPKEEKREKGTAQAVIREILSWVIPFVIALAVAMFLKNYIIINADVPTGSMENTIMPGDRLRRPFYRKPARICVWRARERGYCRIPVSG